MICKCLTRTVSKISNNNPVRINNYLPWILSLNIFRTSFVFLHTQPLVKYFNWEKFHQFRQSWAYKKYGQMDRRTGKVIPIYPQKTLIAGGILTQIYTNCEYNKFTVHTNVLFPTEYCPSDFFTGRLKSLPLK